MTLKLPQVGRGLLPVGPTRGVAESGERDVAGCAALIGAERDEEELASGGEMLHDAGCAAPTRVARDETCCAALSGVADGMVVEFGVASSLLEQLLILYTGIEVCSGYIQGACHTYIAATTIYVDP